MNENGNLDTSIEISRREAVARIKVTWAIGERSCWMFRGTIYVVYVE